MHGTIFTDREMNVRFADSIACGIFRLERSEALGKELYSVIPILRERRREIKSIINMEKSGFVDLTIGERFISVAVRSFSDGVEFTVREDRDGAVKELIQSEKKYRALFEMANDAIFLVKDGRIVEYNRKTLDLFRCSEDCIGSIRPCEMSPIRQKDGTSSFGKAEEKVKAVMDGSPQTFEWIHSRCDGSRFFAEVSLSRIELDGEFYRLAVVRDINEKKKAERELQNAARLAEAARVARETFITNLTDEMSGPINDLVAISDAFMGSCRDSKNFQSAKDIRNLAERVRGRIEELLRLSKSCSEAHLTEGGRFSLEELVAEFLSIYRWKGMQFNVKIDSSLPEEVFGDRSSLYTLVNTMLKLPFSEGWGHNVSLSFRYSKGLFIVKMVYEIEVENIGSKLEDLRVMAEKEGGLASCSIDEKKTEVLLRIPLSAVCWEEEAEPLIVEEENYVPQERRNELRQLVESLRESCRIFDPVSVEKCAGKLSDLFTSPPMSRFPILLQEAAEDLDDEKVMYVIDQLEKI